MNKLNRRKFITMTTGAGIATGLRGPLLKKALAQDEELHIDK